ncbi:hypothetical protein VOI45_01835, partial [Acidaminococcus fermentans]|uniref:hypothetical protein n=1 Tax=Acidaminococcus fermentans TaxID=905 RepID=UPI002E7A1B37
LSAVSGQLPMTGPFSPWQYDKNRLHSQKSALQGRGTVRSTVVGASAAADTLQERWTTAVQ